MKQKFIVLLAAVAVAFLTAACAETDAGLTTKVKSKLAMDDTVKAYQIDVDTNGKVVTLTGSVENQASKERAVALARETEGVANVVDNITVISGPAPTAGTEGVSDAARTAADKTEDAARSAADKVSDAARAAGEKAGDAASKGTSALSDAAITAAVKAKLLADPDVGGLKVDVDTKDGVVTLTGQVKTRAERAQALKLARSTDGVKSVVSNLTLGG